MNDNPIKYSDLISPDDSIDKLIKVLDELNDSYMNFCNNVKQNAVSLKASLQGVSGATEEGRKTIRAIASDTDKLTKAIQERNFAESETAKRLAEIKAATHEANTLAKLQAKLANSAAGSYDALSAQYSMNKMVLNQMSAEERKATKAGQELEAETKAIYEKMKQLQEATGKHTLNVGNYAEATTGLRSQIMQLTEELVRMRMEGKQNTAEYANLQQKAAMLKDAFKDATAEVQNMASDTSTLDSVLSGLGAATGGFAAATGAMRLFGDESEDVQQAQRKLQAAIALVNGVTAIQKNLQHQSALMLGISRIQTNALAKSEAYERLIKIKGNEATWGAVAAQKAFNLVAKANPYVLLATALVSVVGALVAFSRGSKEAEVSTVAQDKAIRNLNDALKEYNMQMDFAIKKAQAEGKSTEEITKMKRAQAAEQVKYSGEVVNQYYAELDAIDEAMKTANRKQRKQLKERRDAVVQNLNDALDARQQAADEAVKLEQDIQVQAITDGKQTQDNLTAMLRKAQDQRNALIKDGYDRERAQRKTATKNAIDDIRKQLKEDTNLTLEEKAALNEQIKLYRQQLAADLKAIDDKQRKDTEAANLAAIRAAQDVELALMDEGAEKRRRQLEIEHQREIEDIDNRLKNEETLTEEQMTALFAMRLNLQKKYDNESKQLDNELALEAFDKQQEVAASEFDLLKKSESEKTQFRLQQEKARWQKILELGMMGGKALSAEEIAIIQNTIQKIEGEINEAGKKIPQDLYDVFGLTLDDDKKAAISESMQYATDALNQWMDLRVEAAERAVSAAEKEVDAAQRAYEFELQAKANGYAADVEQAKKELDLAKNTQKKALEEQAKAQKQQQAIQTIEQIGNLVTATAKIWGQLGFPWAIPAIAVMWGSFAASKIMARNAVQEQYAEGTVELLEGGSHASGHDIDLGTKPDGTRRRAEGGEFFAVINKRNSRRFRKEIPEVINALNNGTFAEKYLNTFNMDGMTFGSTDRTAAELMGIGNDVQAIREQNAKQYYVAPDGSVIIKYKNLTRRRLS